MGKKETRINLNKSDCSCEVEMEPLRGNEDDSSVKPIWVKQNMNEASPEVSFDIEACDTDHLDDFFHRHKGVILKTSAVVAVIIFLGYFITACVLDFKRAQNLFIIVMMVLIFSLYSLMKKLCGQCVHDQILSPCNKWLSEHWNIIRWFVYITLIALIGCWLGLDTAKDPKRLISGGGLIMYIILCYFLSRHRRQVKWRPVIWGIGLQFIFGLLVLRTRPGHAVFAWLGDRVSIFLTFSDAGAKFLFGDNLLAHPFAFKVLPVVVFFSAFIYTVYYMGVMQCIISKIAWLMQKTIGASAAECLNTAGNIFIGQTEAPLMIRPFLPDMTMSELHAVMTSGFATIAGSVLGAYVSFGISPTHLLSACVMNAPAALAVSKLMYPETCQPKTKDVEQIEFDKGNERSIVEALAAGASMSIKLVANIAANLIAFVAMLAFINAILQWLGSMVGYDQLSFQKICAYVCMPLAYMMGVEWKDSFTVGELLGIKVFLNEFIAYDELSKLIKTRKCMNDGTVLSLRSEAIATYALCGFANISSVGIQIGGISALAPKRRGDLARLGFRALLAGTVACFMTACVAGLLYEDGVDDSVVSLKACAKAAVNASTTPVTKESIADMASKLFRTLSNNGFNVTYLTKSV